MKKMKRSIQSLIMMKSTAKVYIKNNQSKIRIPKGTSILIRRCCNATLIEENVEGNYEINVTFIEDDYIRELNKEHRNKDKVTDVLSFPLSLDNINYDINPENGYKMLGDVILSIETAEKQSLEYNHSLDREICYLIVHSVLHLLGYDHEKGGKEARIMREKEEAVMSKLGLSRRWSK
ncbi:MAG: rRNA maturation RNase YbeY [Oscillospiraceae bacterium]